MRNPEDYPEPDEFKPDRFLKRSADGEYVYDDAVRDPRSAVFGFGRRLVAVRHVSCCTALPSVLLGCALGDILLNSRSSRSPLQSSVHSPFRALQMD